MEVTTRELQDDVLTLPATYPALKNTTNVISSSYRFDASIAITIFVFLSALFFIALFSLYVRRFAEQSTISHNRRRGQPPVPVLPSTNPDIMKALPIFSYDSNGRSSVDCSVCLGEFEDRETVKMIPCCRHVYHATCIDTWLMTHATCPLCRSAVEKEVRMNVTDECIGADLSCFGSEEHGQQIS